MPRWSAKVLAAVSLAALLMCGCACAQSVRGDLTARFADIPTIEHQGQTYTLNRRMTAMLLIGVDQTGDVQGSGFRYGGQADFLLLMAIDDQNKRVTPISINRDTMTTVDVYSVHGKKTGTRKAQIALSHAFGDGSELSAEMTALALSRLLLDTPVEDALSMRMEGIAALNDALGGIDVTLEEDFSVYDPTMTAGTTLRLEGKQAEYYLRQRYHVGDQTNISRLERQRAYLEKAAAVLGEKSAKSSSFAVKLYEAVEPYTVSTMSRGKLINMINKLVTYEILPMKEIKGESRIDQNGFMAFYPDEEALAELVISVFYQ